ncbi:MAG: metal-binding protein [Bacteriovoracaceae bacterium]
MASGRWHDRLSLVSGAVSTGALFVFLGAEVAVSYTVGFLFATLMFSPDTDVMPKKRSGLLQFFLYPYSILFKHRGISHALFIGTLTRIIYGVILSSIIFYILNRMGHTQINESDVLNALVSFFTHYDYRYFEYRVITWIFVGMTMADLIHILVDRVSSLLKKLWKILFH